MTSVVNEHIRNGVDTDRAGDQDDRRLAFRRIGGFFGHARRGGWHGCPRIASASQRTPRRRTRDSRARGSPMRGSPPRRRAVATVMAWAAEALQQYLAEVRPLYGCEREAALWLTERGGRISVRHINERFARRGDGAHNRSSRARIRPNIGRMLPRGERQVMDRVVVDDVNIRDQRGAREGVRIDVQQPAWLVLGESYNRGWRATCERAPGVTCTCSAPWAPSASIWRRSAP